MEKMRKMVFELNRDSASGPDSFSGMFFQRCWDTIGVDIFKMVGAFFCGKMIPRFVTHTNLVLLPKKEHVKTLTDLRSVNLCIFVSKIMSRVLHDIIANILPIIISWNHTGFN